MADELDIDPYTAQIVPDTKTTISGHYFDLNMPYAFPRYGNECESYICGRDYMKAVADGIRNAQHFIFIADWQLDYDTELDQRGVAGHPGRLSELLADALQRGVHIRVLCYDSVDGGSKAASWFGSSGPPDTHEEEAQSVLNALPKGKGSLEVAVQNPATTHSINKKGQGGNINFSHHQKFVVIDGKTAFLGGIDIAWGRWDTPAFEVQLDPKMHVLNDAYNAQVTPAREATAAEMALTKKTGQRPGFEPPHYTAGKKLLDPNTQPREPWNDVSIRIDGPAVYDVFVNFVLRWNAFSQGATTNWISDSVMSIQWFENQAKGHTTLVDPLQRGGGSDIVQICRSASSAHLGLELKLWTEPQRKYIHDDWKSPNPKRREIVMAARKAWVGKHQTSIADAMICCINSAKAFVYIENQFFVSDCGSDMHGTRSPASNKIIEALANAIGRAIHNKSPFHVWLVLPEHPEGLLEGDATKSTAWWALQGVKHANNSLIHRINATILARYKKQWGVDRPMHTNKEITEVLKQHGMEEKWRDYLTVVNVRNYGQTPAGVVTEMIYVHSKLTIVDDAVAIIGSANINDRSLSGNGDTELAAVVASQDTQITDVGQNVKVSTRDFARKLRIKLWKKLFGMLIDTPTTGVQKQAAAPLGINLDQPISKASIHGMLSLAITNRMVYNRVFTHTPRNDFATLTEGRNKYPPQTKKVKKYKVNGMPVGGVGPDGKLRDPYVYDDEPVPGTHDFSVLPALQAEYMNGSSHNTAKAMAELRSHIKGFVVEMPLDWGVREVATPKPPNNDNTLIAHNHSRRESLRNA